MKLYSAIYRLMGIKIGRSVKLQGMPYIAKHADATIEIKDNTVIKSSALSNMLGLYQKTHIVARKAGARIVIGKACGLSGVTLYARELIMVGDNTRIGANTKVFDNDFHPIDPVARMENRPEAITSAPVHIGKNVFIGCNALIMKGVTIGDNSVIGAGSVVTKSIPENCVAAGNPARVIRKFEGVE